jgi:hypothetical protein
VTEVETQFLVQPVSVPEFDHYTPARYLTESGAGAAMPGVDAALDRFENLFTEINKLLPAR